MLVTHAPVTDYRWDLTIQRQSLRGPCRMNTLPTLSNLDRLEAEATQVLWEARATLDPVALMFSGGKDSAVLAHLAKKAFTNANSAVRIPFTFVHYDSGANFQEVLNFRDQAVDTLGVALKVYKVQATPSPTSHEEDVGNIRQLIQLINLSAKELNLQGLIGGGRRDEELVRAKERIFSLRDREGIWNPHDQRPEPWNLFNTQLLPGEHMRIFPLSNWTEKNVWEYIAQENIALPSIYFAHQRTVVDRGGTLIGVDRQSTLRPSETAVTRLVRCRTAGDRHTTGFIESSASNAEEVLSELQRSSLSERAGRAEDRGIGTDMESRKRLGWP